DVASTSNCIKSVRIPGNASSVSSACGRRLQPRGSPSSLPPPPAQRRPREPLRENRFSFAAVASRDIATATTTTTAHELIKSTEPHQEQFQLRRSLRSGAAPKDRRG